VSTKERLGRLQGLLERVQARAGAPRGNGAAHHAAPAYAQAAAAYVAPQPAYEEPEPELQPVAAISVAPATPAMQAHTDAPPAEAAYASPEAAGEVESYDDGDVEVSSETVEVDIDIDEAEGEGGEPEPMESGAQPVAQQTMPPEDLDDDVEEQPMATQPSVRPPVHETQEPEEVMQAAATPANEIEEPTPSSSRRPIAGEEPAAEAYEEESAPRHTPPPESGKQVAAPSAHPPSRNPSMPPPSLEGHTLIGGWREPGLGGPQVGVGSPIGVRVPPPPGMGTEPPATIATAPQASGTRLTADVTRPELAASGVGVATFEGAPPVPRPTTLGELLDLTLGL
jgi:hypothetical protein